MDAFSVDIIKGWTRSTCVATIVAAAAEIDLSDAAGKELLKPLHTVLDKCWLIPVHVTLDGFILIFANLEVQKLNQGSFCLGLFQLIPFLLDSVVFLLCFLCFPFWVFALKVTLDADEINMSFRNLQLSYQGSERQPPNNLQLALRFSRVIELKQSTGEHPSQWSAEERLKDAVSTFHLTSGVTARHRIDPDKFKSLLNLIQGTCPEAREVISQHLDRNKWQYSAFSSEQLKSSRWVLHSSPKMANCPMKKALTVTPEAQVMFLKLVTETFVASGRRVRASAKAKMRLTVDQFDRYCDFACVFAAAAVEGAQLSSWTNEKFEAIMKCFYQRIHGLV